jgi:hypothetical protein
MQIQKKPIRIAVIDSGIDTAISGLDKNVVFSTGFRINDKGYITEYPDMETKYQHGTIVSLIIRHICSNVEFISINILNDNISTDGRVLLYAMSKAFDYHPDIIHMSLGTTKWKYKGYIRKITKEADRQNISLVAAANNQGSVSYPAYVKGVFGVKGGNFKEIMQYSYRDDFFYAPLNASGIQGYDGKDLKEACGTSISAAYITGHIANIRLNIGNSSIETIKNILIINSIV